MEKTIELTNKMKVRGWKTSLFFLTTRALIKLCVATLIISFVSHCVIKTEDLVETYITNIYQETLDKLTITKTIKIPSHELPLEDIINRVAKTRKIPSIVLQTIIAKESGAGTHLYRFEPDVYNRLRTTSKLSDDETKMLASSHGAMQVMGFNAETRCGVHWSKLYDEFTGIDCGAKILREELDKAPGKNAGERLWQAFKRYNGSGPRAENYADEALASLGKLFISQLKNEM